MGVAHSTGLQGPPRHRRQMQEWARHHRPQARGRWHQTTSGSTPTLSRTTRIRLALSRAALRRRGTDGGSSATAAPPRPRGELEGARGAADTLAARRSICPARLCRQTRLARGARVTTARARRRIADASPGTALCSAVASSALAASRSQRLGRQGCPRPGVMNSWGLNACCTQRVPGAPDDGRARWGVPWRPGVGVGLRCGPAVRTWH